MGGQLDAKRTKLLAALQDLPPEMRRRLKALKAEGRALRKRPDLLWYLLLQSAATQGNSRGWVGLCGDPVTLASVSFAKLATMTSSRREAALLAALQKAKVRMPTIKAQRLAANLARIIELGGVEAATKLMLSLPDREAKLQFIRSFAGIGEKYGRNIWMDIYDPAFRDAVAIDERLKKVAKAMGFVSNSYQEAEQFYCQIAEEAGLEPWELDRLLYQFTDHFLEAVGYEIRVSKRRTSSCQRPRLE